MSKSTTQKSRIWNPNPREGWMAVNQWPAACQLSQRQGITAQGQTGKGHKLVINNEILQCSRVLPTLGHFTTLSAVRGSRPRNYPWSCIYDCGMWVVPPHKNSGLKFLLLLCTFSTFLFSLLPFLFLTCLRGWGDRKSKQNISQSTNKILLPSTLYHIFLPSSHTFHRFYYPLLPVQYFQFPWNITFNTIINWTWEQNPDS